MAPINNHRQFDGWLKEQSQNVRVAIATRSVLRVFPIATHQSRPGAPQINLTLLTARCILTSGVAAKIPTLDVRNAAVVAADAATNAIHAAHPADAVNTIHAADVAQAAVDAARAAIRADLVGHAASAAAFAARAAAVAADSADTTRATFSDSERDLRDLMIFPLWENRREPDWLIERVLPFPNILNSDPDWTFWRRWYRGFLIGEPLDWELQRQVALIDNAIWEAGPKAVATKIEEIRKDLGTTSVEEARQVALEPTETQKKSTAARVEENRDAIALSVAGILQQLEDYREKLRGLNSLDPDVRDEILSFVENLNCHLQELLTSLSIEDDEPIAEKGGGFIIWCREFRDLLPGVAARYAEPENVVEATVPTSIILGCAGLGALIGGPVGAGAGGVVGSLISNQMKPGQAAKAILESGSEPSADP